MEEKIAISHLKQGNLDGLEILVQRYQARAVHSAHLILHDRELAEDVAQTAFIRVAEKIEQFDENRPFAPWLFKIVVNEALKVARLQKRTFSFNEGTDDDVITFIRLFIDPQPQPEKSLEIKETYQKLWAALDRLSPEQRAVVTMRYFLEMSEADMCDRLDHPLSTIKWWLRAARGQLRSLLHASRVFEDGD